MGPSVHEVGQRLTIRLRIPEGGFRDLLGILESETSIRRRDGSLSEFLPEDVVVWRVIEPPKDRAGHGAPLSLRIRDIEAAANATWPALETAQIGDWLLRASGKFTLRANSALPLGPPPYGNPGIDIHEGISRVIDFYSAHNLPAVFHIPLPTYGQLEELLREEGWVEKVTVLVMVADIGDFQEAQRATGNWEIESSPTEEWLNFHNDHGVAQIMKGVPARYAGLRINGVLVAGGRAAIHEKWCALSRLYVHPDFRRQGIAKELVQNLLKDAKDLGATKSLLQVDESNLEAISLYEKLGFAVHHSYVYLIHQPE